MEREEKGKKLPSPGQLPINQVTCDNIKGKKLVSSLSV